MTSNEEQHFITLNICKQRSVGEFNSCTVSQKSQWFDNLELQNPYLCVLSTVRLSET